METAGYEAYSRIIHAALIQRLFYGPDLVNGIDDWTCNDVGHTGRIEHGFFMSPLDFFSTRKRMRAAFADDNNPTTGESDGYRFLQISQRCFCWAIFQSGIRERDDDL